jgi:hypothetical protein
MITTAVMMMMMMMMVIMIVISTLMLMPAISRHGPTKVAMAVVVVMR